MSKHEDTDDENRINRQLHPHKIKEAIHERDRQQCINCLASREIVDKLDVDHNVPRGVGGSELYSNQGSLCRRCHDAKHGEGIAPTIQIQSTGRMPEVDFIWFRHFLKEMIPTMAQQNGVRLGWKFDIQGQQIWYYPLGDIRRLDKEMNDELDDYRTLQASEYL